MLLLSATARHADAQGSGSISGRVTVEATGLPLGDARVMTVSGSAVATTNADGRYTLRVSAPASHDIRIIHVGFQEQKHSVAVAVGQTATLDVVMSLSIVKLQEVVTTATGEQRRVELGNTVATLDVAKRVEDAPVKNFGDLLAAKEPGVQVLPSNMTSGGSRVRIRGSASFTLSNDPIYVIDGIRLTSGSTGNNGSAIGVGGTTPNRVNDINPEDIENIEIVKGPSAATLYGTDAANGVIVITTKRGRAGAARWTVFDEHGQLDDRNHYPATYAILGHLAATPTVARKCVLTDLVAGGTLSAAAGGPCIKDSTTMNDIFTDPNLTMIKLGWRDNYGGSVSGGTDVVRYFVSTDIQREIGVFGLPAFNLASFAASKTPVPDTWNHPNTLGQGSFRGNMNIAVNPQLDIAVSTGFTKLDQRLPQVDNNINSFWYNAETGPGWKGAGPGYTGIGSLGQPLMGYGGFTPGEIFQDVTTQDVQRFIGSTNANWRPLSWLSARGDIGMDLTDREDFNLCMFAQCPDFGTQRLGVATDIRTNLRNFTTNMGATADWAPRNWMDLKSTVGMQYVNFKSDLAGARGQTLPPGAQTAPAGTIPTAYSTTVQQNTLGFFIEEAAAFNDRLYVTAAVRTDQNSAFGTNFQRVYYPKGAISWIISEESFFPRQHMDWLNQFRLRASMGASGVQPGPTDALQTFTTTTTAVNGADITGLRSNTLGNPNIRPERTTEFEGGFDMRILKNRVNIEVTYYNKHSQDALFGLTPAPSAGSAQTSIRTNLGSVQNTGGEFLVNAQILDSRAFGWDVTFSASHIGNKLVVLGKDLAGNALPFPGLNTTVQERPGYPLFGYWSRPFTYSDANHDGIIAPSEVSVDTTWRFEGYSQPRDEVSLTNGFELLNRKLRINMLVDYKGGNNLFNNEEGFLCQQTKSCPYTSTFSASLYNQARTVAENTFGTLNTQWGFAEPLRFWRIRELSATYTFSDQLMRKIARAQGGSVNLAVRNLKLWTAYTGVDPEANYAEGNTQNTLLTAGPPTYYQFRLNLRY
jgi:TonB-linked SusC/RagA family outer membrane protein